MKIQTITLLVVFAFVFADATGSICLAQNENGRRGFDLQKWMNDRDKNKSGMLEPDELNDRERTFVEKMGVDVSGAISINDVIVKVEREREELNKRKADEEFGKLPRKVPGFGEPVEQFSLPGFGGNSEEPEESASLPTFEVTEDQIFEATASIRDQFGNDISRRVDSVFNSYDKDRNGVLDPNEIATVPWTSPAWEESDENKDGQLTKIEMAKRYQSGGGRESNDRGNRREDQRSDNNGREERRVSRRPDRRAENTTPNPTTTTTSSSTVGSKSVSSRAADYVRTTLNQNDTNKNGKLDGDELKSIGIMKKADSNADGEITYEEMLAYSTGDKPTSNSVTESPASDTSRNRGKEEKRRSSARNAVPNKSQENENRLIRDLGQPERFKAPVAGRIPVIDEAVKNRRERLSRDFASKDRNKDGYIQLTEFASKLTVATLEEFRQRDLDGDGFITPTEWTQKIEEAVVDDDGSGEEGTKGNEGADEDKTEENERGPYKTDEKETDKDDTDN